VDRISAINWTLVQSSAANGAGLRRLCIWYHRGMLIALAAAINGGWLEARP
jgi:hypothetical protein